MIEQGMDRLAERMPNLARLGIVYADELRMKIVTEAYTRAISPTQFFSEFGGGSVPRVAQHFYRLADWDWLVLERTETGGSRRGAVEHFWRAPELVIFEEEDWAVLPTSLRAGFSWVTFEQLTERVGAAMTEGSFDASPDRHLSWTPLVLDREGWQRILGAADVVFRSALEEQQQADVRLADSGEDPVHTTVGIAVFESPYEGADEAGPYVPAGRSETTATFNSATFFPMLSRVFGSPINLRIIDLLNRREMSPKLLHAAIPEVSLAGHDRRVKKLSGQGWAAEVQRKTGGARRSATEHFYRAVGPALIDNPQWGELPVEVRKTISARTFEELRERVKVAIDAGTFDARPDRHLTWSLLRLDGKGWRRVVGLVDGLLAALAEEQAAARKRLERSGEAPIAATVGLTAFESAKTLARVP